MLMELARWVSLVTGILMAAGTLASFSRSPHWSIRLWDFPRVQIVFAAAAAGTVYAYLFLEGHPAEWAFLTATAATVAWQLRKILPYTPLWRAQVERSRETGGAARFRLLIANVQYENTEYHRLLDAVRGSDPDMVLTLETGAGWASALQPLAAEYPHVVRQPQENYYGMMFFSRLELIGPRVEFLVQDDIPSLHAEFDLPGGPRVTLHGLHPRPPEPIRDQDSTPRDAELVMLGRDIGDGEKRPTVVAGDLNDVAWSHTTELFLRLSGLLDPRVGRGLFSSYNAKNPIFRYPLDHVFHSNHFRLVEMRRLERIGSDHFPVLIELSYEPDGPATQPENEEKPGDSGEAAQRLAEQARAARTGEDRPGRE